MKWERLVPFILFLGGWYAVTDIWRLVTPFFLPSPVQVFDYIFGAAGDGDLLEAIAASLGRFVAGLLIGLGLGAILAVCVASSRRLAAIFIPLAKFFQAIAGVAWIPLAVLWFGISSAAAIFIITNTTFFVAFYTTLTGVQAINPKLEWSVRSMGGTTAAVLRHVIIPGALPHILSGLRIAVGYGWRTLIGAEIIASGLGLGVLIWDGQRFLDTSQIFAGLLIIGTISFFMDRCLVRPLERRTVERWGMVSRA
jgi:NitT/TauT family transport system permease protein/taurine transport system permease protein